MSGIYPSPEHIEHIQFDGRDCVVLSPEDYEEMHFDITHLRARVADLEASERDGLVIHTPLPVFGDGPWIFTETGQKFTGDELNIEAFCRYRNALEVAPNIHYCPGHTLMWREFRESGGVTRELTNVVPYKQTPKGSKP